MDLKKISVFFKPLNDKFMINIKIATSIKPISIDSQINGLIKCINLFYFQYLNVAVGGKRKQAIRQFNQ